MAHRHNILRLVTGLGVFLVFGCLTYAAQQPSPPVPPSDEAASGQGAKPKPSKYSHANDFLIRGTVFNDKALSLAGAQLRIRRSGDKKFRWESYTNSRGEFAMRVPQGSEYEIVVRVKGYTDQTRAINAKNGGADEGFVFRMQPLGGKP